jgi:CheY-like chemotaxis protein
MNEPQTKQTILIVDDTPENIDLLTETLDPYYHTKIATNGEKALKIAFSKTPPDLILLDIMMPGMSGYEVCSSLKENPGTNGIPVIFVTAMSELGDEKKGLEMGAVDYITKPINNPIVLARVRTHLALYNQTRQLEEWNQSLERRVSEGIAHIERLDRLRRFFSPGVADLLLNSHTDDHLKAQRREIVVIFLDIHGYTEFTEAHEPEDVMCALGEFHTAMGELVMAYDGTLERFTGDGMMIFFNAPIEIQNPALRAVNMAIDMQAKMAQLGADYWLPRGHELTMGIGIAQGFATIGAIGFEGRRDYGAIGRVTNLSARLCGKAKGAQILCCEVTEANISNQIKVTPIPNLTFKGFDKQIKAFQIDHELQQT